MNHTLPMHKNPADGATDPCQNFPMQSGGGYASPQTGPCRDCASYRHAGWCRNWLVCNLTAAQWDGSERLIDWLQPGEPVTNAGEPSTAGVAGRMNDCSPRNYQNELPVHQDPEK